MYALSAKTGRQSGTFPVGGAVSGLTVVGPTLLVGGADGKVHAFLTGDLGYSWTSDSRWRGDHRRRLPGTRAWSTPAARTTTSTP